MIRYFVAFLLAAGSTDAVPALLAALLGTLIGAAVVPANSPRPVIAGWYP